MKTRTGGFPIGFRGGWSEWQKDFARMGAWACEAGFELIDIGAVSPEQVNAVRSGGVDVVSVDMLDWSALLSEDAGKRRDAVARNAAYFGDMAALGVRVFFTVLIPENPEAPPRNNFALAVDSFGELAAVADSLNATIVLEGWPGGPPHYPNLCCNPESCRAMLREVPSRGLSLNYDPSHLIRMGIDHVRFIDEFATRVGHVHGKDTELLADNLYDIGLFQKSLDQPPYFCGEYAWRYTIPGHGVTRWGRVLKTLTDAGYRGVVSVELEDADYNGTETGEKAGLLASLSYLQTV